MSSKSQRPKGKPISYAPYKLRDVFSNEAVRTCNLVVSWLYAYKSFGTESFFGSIIFASFGFLTLRCNRIIYARNKFIERLGIWIYLLGMLIGLAGWMNFIHAGLDESGIPIIGFFNNLPNNLQHLNGIIVQASWVWWVVILGAIFDTFLLETAEQKDVEADKASEYNKKQYG